MNKKNEIKNIINSSINPEDNKYVSLYLDSLEDDEKNIKKIIDEDYCKIKNYINSICITTFLDYSFSSNEIKFFNKDNDIFSIIVKDGKVNYSKKTGFNILYFEIVEKYKNNLEELALLHKKVRPFLEQLNDIKNKKRILNGQNIYIECLRKKDYEKELKLFLKSSNKKIEKIKQKIYSATGWYYLDEDMFGMIDVDRNIINAIQLKDKWYPFVDTKDKKKIAEKFILDNITLLNNYKIEKKIIESKIDVKNNMDNNIKREIEVRGYLVDDFKKNFEGKQKLKQKII